MRSQTVIQALQTRLIELEKTNEQLEEKAALLALTSKHKTQFLANMSHELRTPLNSLLLLARLLADNRLGNLDADQVASARTIHASGSDLLALINEILDLSRIESGTMAVDLMQVSVTELREDVEGGFLPIADETGLTFRVEVADDLPRHVETDAKRLRQILRNLLSNAFRFTHQGTVTLRLAVAASGWDPRRRTLEQAAVVLALSVSDTGIGIAEDEQGVIFEAFKQADRTTGRTYGGTGLGLSISREMAQLLGGELCVMSTPGVGSTFTLYLPQPCPAKRRRAPAPPTLAPPTLGVRAPAEGPTVAGRRVLVVDDDIRNLFAVTSVLETAGMAVRVATSGVEAIAAMQSVVPAIELVLMDVLTPGVEGYEAMRVIRGLPGFATLPIIALTAEALPGDREKCLAAGASDHVSKPLDAGRLLSLLRRWLEPE